ncbi:MAG: hypothetical protein RMJ98_03780 [Myxococcales bacterium]|nr:hypothetical protein [Polyangiaceae bacterium]MDW8248409.1 hypothetical protein [Myxococcales bacterium]
MITKEHMLDVRVRDRYQKRGLISTKEIEKYLNELPDVADQAEEVTLPQPALRTEAHPTKE